MKFRSEEQLALELLTFFEYRADGEKKCPVLKRLKQLVLGFTYCVWLD